MKAKNIKRRNDNACKCSSWLKHWEKFSYHPATYCSEKNCMEMTGLVGAHVQKMNSDEWYIIPLCKKHCVSSHDLEISDYVDFIPAEKVVTFDITTKHKSGISMLFKKEYLYELLHRNKSPKVGIEFSRM